MHIGVFRESIASRYDGIRSPRVNATWAGFATVGPPQNEADAYLRVMLKVGLTGGIGSGKSWVSARLAALGAVVIDADLLAREVVATGTPGFEQVVERFGPQVVGPDGELDRAALGKRVFADAGELADLNAIVHPAVGTRASELMAEAERGSAPAVVHDVPLLVENGLQDLYDVVVVVDTPVEAQLARLVGQRGMTDSDARARIARQAGREQRLAVADEVLLNHGTLQQLGVQVDVLWTRLTARGWRNA
jgi:dephospho-CoA kinase